MCAIFTSQSLEMCNRKAEMALTLIPPWKHINSLDQTSKPPKGPESVINGR